MPQSAFALRFPLCASICAAGLIGVAAWAQTPGTASQVERERANCDGVQQDRDACRREAGAARQEAQRGGLAPAGQGDQNALARCQLQPAADRADCEARVKGGATSTSGSVMGGGVIRETVTPVPAPPPSR